jgi:hypothetical protein
MDNLTHRPQGAEDAARDSDGGIADHIDDLHDRPVMVWPGDRAQEPKAGYPTGGVTGSAHERGDDSRASVGQVQLERGSGQCAKDVDARDGQITLEVGGRYRRARQITAR